VLHPEFVIQIRRIVAVLVDAVRYGQGKHYHHERIVCVPRALWVFGESGCSLSDLSAAIGVGVSFVAIITWLERCASDSSGATAAVGVRVPDLTWLTWSQA
jgi:hypothetical protein